MGLFSKSKAHAEAPADAGPSHASTGQAAGEVLLRLDDVQVYAVEDGTPTLLDQGPLVLYTGPPEGSEGSERDLTAVVNERTSWLLTATLPVLRNAVNTYTFAVAGGGLYFSLLLAHATPPAEVGLLEDILAERTSYEVYQGAGGMDKAQKEAAVAKLAHELETEQLAAAGLAPDQVAAPPAPAANTHVDRIARGAAKVSGAVTAGALWATSKMESHSEAMKAKIKPVVEPIPVPGIVKGTVKTMRNTAWRGAGFVGAASSRTADVALRIADGMTKRMGKTVFGNSLNSEGHTRSQAARDIAAASLVAASQVYDAMEEATLLVLNSAKDSGSSVIAHKYGPDVGNLARDATSIGVASAVGASRIKGFGVQTMATKIARRTAKGLVSSAVLAAKEQQAAQAAARGTTLSPEAAEISGPYARLAEKGADRAAAKGVDSLGRK